MTDPVPLDDIDAIIEAWRQAGEGHDPASIGIVSRIWYLAKLFGDDRRRLLDASGIDPAILDLLSVLRRSGPPFALTTREIAARSLVSAGAISQRLNRAEAAGLVSRQMASDESRAVVVTLTDVGSDAVARYVHLVLARERELLASFSPSEQAALADDLRRLLHGVTGELDASPRTQVGT